MAESPPPLRIASDIGGAAGLVGLMVTGLLHLLSLPLPLVLVVGSVSFGALCVGLLGHVFLSNSLSFETLGNLTPLSPPPPLSRERSLPEEPTEERHVLLGELEEEYEIKKLEPTFVDFGNEYVVAYNDEKGVIVRGPASGGESFHVLARSLGNQHPRNKVKSVKKVSFRLNFICFDRATRNKCETVNIHRSAWLTEAETEVDFPAHCPPRRAIIVTAEGAENRVYAIRRDSDSSYKNILPVREELAGSIYTVFLTLLVESRNAANFQYILEVIREPSFELRLNDAVLWKSTHLRKFIDEGFAFSTKVREIWKDANDQVPLPKLPDRPNSWGNILLSGALNASEEIDYPAALARIRAIEREQEEKLLDAVREWQVRAADWVDLFIGAAQRDQLLQCMPSIEDGFNRAQRRGLRGFFRVSLTPPGGEPPPPKLPYWTLSDAISSRTDKLMNILQGLK